jgi:hypothetical protein
MLCATVLADLKELISGYRGETELVLDLETSAGRRRLRLGPEFRVERSAALDAELRVLLGEAMLNGASAAGEPAVRAGAA